jgi:aconitate hydratase
MSLKSDTKKVLKLKDGSEVVIFSLEALAKKTGKNIKRLPYSIRILAENMLRNVDGKKVVDEDVMKVLDWDAKAKMRPEIPFMPARVVMQDFTGVPAIVDLASMRDAIKTIGGKAEKINPLVDTALVVDHSVQVDFFGNNSAYAKNVALEYERNSERYTLLKWAQKAFQDFRVVPPGMGIIHQVNLEYFAHVVMTKKTSDGLVAYPDTLVGTDSHTTMINGLGVMGWGVGGIEAEAVMLGQPYYMELPDVIGVHVKGKLREGVTATDLVLYVTEMLRKQGVVGKFVEFFGEGLEHMNIPDRATIGNMSPEYGATMGFSPVDQQTLDYLKLSNREQYIDLVKTVCNEQLLFRNTASEQPEYTVVLELDQNTMDSTLAGPKRPQDRVGLRDLKKMFHTSLTAPVEKRGFGLTEEQTKKSVKVADMDANLKHGDVVIAAITSCTNTSNPYVMIGAGLLARNAVEKGLKVKPYVKTSLAPGSQVVSDYLDAAGLTQYLDQLEFNLVGYGCTTCIGNSGDLPENVGKAVKEGDLVAAAVLSGNRNFEGRINPLVKANYLASPLHVVAFALAGTVDFDPEKDSLGNDKNGKSVYLKDIWPKMDEISKLVESLVTPEMFKEKYSVVFDGTKEWQELKIPTGQAYQWDNQSTYIQNPPFFEDLAAHKEMPAEISGMKVLALLGDSVTTDHISPAGSIPESYPAGQYLIQHGVKKADFNSYGSRRGNHEVMMRGTFGNVRLRNLLVPGKEGSYTRYHENGETMFIYDAAMKYKEAGTPLLVIAGKEYGTGSSRDWAAKGTTLLGVKAVIAETYERIHRSNLVGMGVLPLQFYEGENREGLGLTGLETYTIKDIAQIKPRQKITIEAKDEQGQVKSFDVQVRLDNDIEVEYYQNGGILPTVLKNLV